MQRTTLTRWLIAAALLGRLPTDAVAQVTTDRSASIIVFPKVIADGMSDTIIQLANESGGTVRAHCFYVNGAPVVLEQPPGPANPALWAAIDFDITLTTLQPTHWVASRGRSDDQTDGACDLSKPPYCDGAGLDPGRVPALPSGFRGELLCFEVDSQGAPIGGNHLIGVATVQHLTSGDVAKYHAIGMRGRDTNDSNGALCLGGDVTAECPTGAEYDACPDTWILNHFADGAADALSDSAAALATSITVVPCSHDLENQVPRSVTLQFTIVNELEQTFSAATTVTCWADTPLANISPVFNRETLGGDFAQTRIRAQAARPGGFLVVAQTFRTASAPSSPTTSSMVNVHVEGTQSAGDVIRIPVQDIPTGAVR